jgi:hypothetical protein
MTGKIGNVPLHPFVKFSKLGATRLVCKGTNLLRHSSLVYLYYRRQKQDARRFSQFHRKRTGTSFPVILPTTLALKQWGQGGGMSETTWYRRCNKTRCVGAWLGLPYSSTSCPAHTTPWNFWNGMTAKVHTLRFRHSRTEGTMRRYRALLRQMQALTAAGIDTVGTPDVVGSPSTAIYHACTKYIISFRKCVHGACSTTPNAESDYDRMVALLRALRTE